ncbi:hypothetical protein K439DRAFT_1629367, partial [Ramaria rubella]
MSDHVDRREYARLPVDCYNNPFVGLEASGNALRDANEPLWRSVPPVFRETSIPYDASRHPIYQSSSSPSNSRVALNETRYTVPASPAHLNHDAESKCDSLIPGQFQAEAYQDVSCTTGSAANQYAHTPSSLKTSPFTFGLPELLEVSPGAYDSHQGRLAIFSPMIVKREDERSPSHPVQDRDQSEEGQVAHIEDEQNEVTRQTFDDAKLDNITRPYNQIYGMHNPVPHQEHGNQVAGWSGETAPVAQETRPWSPTIALLTNQEPNYAQTAFETSLGLPQVFEGLAPQYGGGNIASAPDWLIAQNGSIQIRNTQNADFLRLSGYEPSHLTQPDGQ